MTVSRAGRNTRLSEAMGRLRESSAQIQTRADLALVAIVVGITPPSWGWSRSSPPSRSG